MNPRKITFTQEAEIINLSEKQSNINIAKIYKVSNTTVRNILKKHGIKHKKSRLNMSKLSLDIDYFGKIDSAEKAYWLGYLCADGHITPTGGKIVLVSKDKEIIERFLLSIKSQHKLSEEKVYDKRTGKTCVKYQTQITNAIFAKNLINLGVTNDKTNSQIMPNINELFFSYFFAGLFDGDGSINICIPKHKIYKIRIKKKMKTSIRINLISTKEVLRFLQKILFDKFKVDKTKLFRVTLNKPNVWKLYLYKDAMKFLDFIYYDTTFKYLQRKYDIYKTYKSISSEFIKTISV